MLLFTLENNADRVVVTLTEKVTLNEPYFLFTFTHIETRQTVEFIRASDADESASPERYNQYTIDTAALFEGKPDGEWIYKVYEQESEISEAGSLLEQGKMQLVKDRDTVFTAYESATSFKAYNG